MHLTYPGNSCHKRLSHQRLATQLLIRNLIPGGVFWQTLAVEGHRSRKQDRCKSKCAFLVGCLTCVYSHLVDVRTYAAPFAVIYLIVVYTQRYLCFYMSVYIFSYVYIHIYVLIVVYLAVSKPLYVYIYTHRSMSIIVPARMGGHTCIYIYMYTYM